MANEPEEITWEEVRIRPNGSSELFFVIAERNQEGWQFLDRSTWECAWHHVDDATSVRRFNQKLDEILKEHDPRYPIGQFTWSGSNTAEQRAALVNDLAAFPHSLRKSVAGLTDAQLDTPYRDGGWTVRQVVHHLTDAHINAYVRLRLGLTEDEPTIKTFDEARWAELVDAKTGAIAPSLDLLDGLHHRWIALLRSLSERDVKRKLRHPEMGLVTIDEYIARWAWHAKHHVEHIRALRERMNW